MSAPTLAPIKAHYDGKVIIPDEPFPYEAGEAFQIIVFSSSPMEQPPEPVGQESDPISATERPKRGSVEALARWSGRVVPPPGFDPYKMTREDLYD